MQELIADGILVATPAGSTAYNLSVNGPILPLNAPLLALTPISRLSPPPLARSAAAGSCQDPDRGSGAGEPAGQRGRRPHGVPRRVAVCMSRWIAASIWCMLHDPGHSLDERILREQFGY